jgi:hypothetical protein
MSEATILLAAVLQLTLGASADRVTQKPNRVCEEKAVPCEGRREVDEVMCVQMVKVCKTVPTPASTGGKSVKGKATTKS